VVHCGENFAIAKQGKKMKTTIIEAVYKSFLCPAPDWYQKTNIAFLIVNPIIFILDPYIAG